MRYDVLMYEISLLLNFDGLLCVFNRTTLFDFVLLKFICRSTIVLASLRSMSSCLSSLLEVMMMMMMTLVNYRWLRCLPSMRIPFFIQFSHQKGLSRHSVNN